MGKEIERKYLVKNLDYRAMAEKSVEICQGYLSRDPERTVRVRVKGDCGFFTVKGITNGCERLEFEYPIPYTDAMELLSLCIPPIIEKTRYLVPYEDKLWEVDEFHGAREGLAVAEIELSSSDEAYSLPGFVGEEVTGDPQYYNSNL